MKETNYIIISKNCTAKELALLFEKKKINPNFLNLAIKVHKKKIIGIITLGDLRRILVKHGRNVLIEKYLNNSPIVINEKYLNNQIRTFLDRKYKKKQLKKINELIVLNNNKEIIAIKNIEEIETNSFYKGISVIGLGHIGLPFAVHLLKKFSHVNGFDIDNDKIKNIKKNKLNFYEKNFEKELQRNIKSKRLLFLNKIKNLQSQIYIICLGTDIKNNRLISNKNLIKTASSLGKLIKKNDLVILRGTVQVGTSRNIFIKILEKYSQLKCGEDFYFSYLPERIIEGNALYELENVPQLVSGFSKKCKQHSLEFCSKVFKSTIELDSLEEGEIIKLASNAYRDLNFAFSNDIARISSYYGLSGSNLIRNANLGYPRNFIAKPSMGVGGFCLPKDPYLFSKLIGNNKRGYSLAKNSRLINENSIEEVFKKIKEFQKQKIKKKKLKVFIFGITFKGMPETIDIRNSPSLDLAAKLIKNNCKINFYDVMYHKLKKINFKHSKILTNNSKLMNKADVIVIANFHPDYSKIIQESLKYNHNKDYKLIFDCWSLLDSQSIENLNWNYKNI